MRILVICICTYTFFLSSGFCSNSISLSLESKDIKYVSISPEIFGEYDVVIEIFGPSQSTLASITGTNIGRHIDIYISDILVARYPITARIDSGIIGIGRYDKINDALSRIADILTALNKSKQEIPGLHLEFGASE